MASPYKKMTVTVEAVEPGKLRGQRIVRAKSRRVKVEFDLIEDLLKINEGDKIVIEFHKSKPSSMDKYLFCGQGYMASKPEDSYTIFSIWGLIFRFEPSIGLEPETKYYLCVKHA